jgi:hypothetical protein
VLFGGFGALVLMLAAPFLMLGALAFVVAFLSRPCADNAARVASERSVRAEIDREQLGLLLRSL